MTTIANKINKTERKQWKKYAKTSNKYSSAQTETDPSTVITHKCSNNFDSNVDINGNSSSNSKELKLQQKSK